MTFYLTAFFISVSFFLLQSNSFTTAEVKNETTLSISSEEDALIAITYGEGRMFAVTNNTENEIRIESEGNNIEDAFSSYIGSGTTEAFSIAGDPEGLIGGSIQIIAHWDGGSAEIKSMIPQVNIEQILLELIEEDVALELEEKQIEPESNDEEEGLDLIEEEITELLEDPMTEDLNSEE